MTFVSNFKALRTYDPDTGWELFTVPMGVGVEAFELRHPSNGRFPFWGIRPSAENTGRQLPDGRPEGRTVFDVLSINEAPTTKATAEQKQLIEDSIRAFGIIHDGPIGPTEVLFENNS